MAALEGRTGEAIAEAREPMAELEQMSAMVDYGFGALALIRAAGPDVPEIRQWAERAHAIFERMGARPFAEQLANELAAKTAQPAARPVAPRTGVPAAG